MNRKTLSLLLLIALLPPLSMVGQVFSTAPAKAPAPMRAGCVAPSNVQVTPGPTVAIVNWESDQTMFNLRYAEAGNILNFGFEDGTFGEWTTIDNDGDGFDWMVNNQFGSHSGSYIAVSASYDNDSEEALLPDNYLVSPRIELGGSISFWACAQDASWAEEHFGVAVSTTTNNASAFTTIAEWDMSAKSAGNPTKFTRGGNRAQGTWYKYSVDLSAYAGQVGYVAIRHFDCSDWFYLDVDDISINLPGELKWNTVEGITETTYTIPNLMPESVYVVQVTPACDEQWSDMVQFTTIEACPAPTDLTAYNVMPTSATLTWSGWLEYYELQYAVIPEGKNRNRQWLRSGKMADGETLRDRLTGWLYYDNGAYATSIGAGGSVYWGSMFPAAMLEPYAGNSLTKVSLHTSYEGVATLNVYLGGNQPSGTPVISQDFNMMGDGDFMEIVLDEPLTIDGTQNLWVTFFQEGITYPIDACTDTGDANNRWVSINGSQWMDLATAGLSGYGWMIRACIEADFDPSTLDWVTIPRAMPPYELTDLTPGTRYAAQVRSACGNDETSSTIFVTPEACGAPTNLTAVEIMPTQVTLSWIGYQENYNVKYRIPGEEVTTFFEDFENGIGDWTIIDADGDGFNWMSNLDMGAALNAHSGSGVAYSQSYSDDDEPLTPDNWLISPRVELGGIVKFWACGQDPAYCEENFAIYVSTTGTNPSNFTQISEEFTATGEYLQYSADLSAYSGMGYVAIRHFNCTDMFYLNIDDFGIYTGEISGGTDWYVLEDMLVDNDHHFTLEGLETESTYEVMVQGNCTKYETTPWSESLFFTTLSSCERPTIVAVNEVSAEQATVVWTGYHDAYNLRYRSVELDYTADFSNGIPEGWTTFDEDGDGYNWIGEAGFVYSESYNNDYGELFPDNWLVTSQINMGGFVEIVAAALDPDWPDEHFAIYYSLNSTNPSTFVQISDEFVATGEGAYYTIDLSEYSGTGYLAIRHFNCTDQFALAIAAFDVFTGSAWTTVSNVTSPYVIDGLTEESIFEVTAQGICSPTETSDWADSYYFMTPASCLMPTDVEVDDITANSVSVSWTGDQETYNIQYRIPGEEVVSFFDDFEDGLGNWTIIDADGDGYVWSESSDFEAHGGVGVAYSASYINNLGALTPDNWLVTPQVQLGGTVKFWAKGQDPSYAAEHFAVYVSTTGNNIANFEQVSNEFVATGSYVQYSVDLTGYSGMGYVAIRHFNCTDMFYLDLDDFGIYTGEVVGGTDWVVIEGVQDNPYVIEGLDSETNYELQVQGVCEDGVSYWSDVVTFTTEPSCLAPTSVHFSDITYNSAVVSWIDGNGAASWQIEVIDYAVYGTTAPGTVTPITVTENPYTITDLEPNNSYVVYVYANCEAGEVSAPSALAYFTTTKSPCTAPTGLTADNVGANTADITWTFADDVTQWEIAYGTEEEVIIEEGGSYYLNEEALAPIAVNTPSYLLEGLAPATSYYVFVRSVCGDYPPSAWIDAYTSFVTEECPAVDDLNVADITHNSAAFSWVGEHEAYELEYTKAPTYFDFEDGSLMGWTTIDSDGDGNDWYLVYNSQIVGHEESMGFVSSASYSGVALTPDNYLVSPQMTLGGSFSFYANAQDADWPEEHFGVAVSTNGNTSAADFTTIAEWDMTAKAVGAWYLFTVDLSAYEGERGYVAIRHFDCSDWFRLNVDDISFVYGDAEPMAVNWISVDEVSSPYTLEGLEANTDYLVRVRGVCGGFGGEWATASFTTLEAPTDVEQELTLSVGWGWFSSYIEYPADALTIMEEGIAAGSESGLIKSQTQAVTLNEGEWGGTLTELHNESMYLILSEGGEVTLSGPLADPTEHPISISGGWNWIGYISANAMPVSEALASITPAENDQIKTQGAYSSYDSEDGWNGALSVLEPGKGYLYLHNGGGAELVYPSSSKGGVVVPELESYWKADHHAYPTNLTMMVTLEENQIAMRKGSHEIGAFVNGECRGSARLQEVNGRYIAFLTVSGEDGEEVVFRLYDVTTGTEYAKVAEERISYQSDAVYGTMKEPMRMHFNMTGVGENDGTVSLYPNPTSAKVLVQGNGIESVRVYNAMGQLLHAEEGLSAEQVELNLGQYSAGVYTVSVTMANGQTSNNMVVKK